MAGISDPYEEPLNLEVVCETDKETLEESAAKVIDKLEEMGYIPKATPCTATVVKGEPTPGRRRGSSKSG